MTPDRAQKMGALDAANRVRSGRVAVKRQLAAGEITVVRALELDCCKGMTVLDVVRAQHRCGPVRAAKAIRRAGVNPNARVDELCAAQRRRVDEAARAAGSYPQTVVARAQFLARSGLTRAEVTRRVLADTGYEPTDSTVGLWIGRAA